MCDIYIELQGINRPSENEDYIEYSRIVYESIYKALENSLTPEEAIKKIKSYTNSNKYIYNYINFNLS